MAEITIASRPIGQGHAPYFIAELSANHGGTLEKALEIMEAAKWAGADAIKLQTYTADTLTIDHDGPDFTINGGLWNGYSLYRLYQEAHTPWEWHEALFAKGRELGLPVFSTPFDVTAVDFLEGFNPPVYKIASFEAADHEILTKVARTGKPVIMSTGMVDPMEIGEAMEVLTREGSREIALLHCVSAYPASPADSNLRTIPHLIANRGVVAGLSDHTLGSAVSVAAVALGASIIEKHFTLARADGGPDGAFSMEPAEFRSMVDDCRTAWESLGGVCEGRQQAAEGNRVFRRSLYVVQPIAAGSPLTLDNVRSIRPGYGLAPKHLPDVIGRTARRDIARGTALSWNDIV